LSNLPEGDVPSRFDDSGYALMVADGMGGAAGGEVASRMAISTLVNVFLDVPDWIMKPDDERAEEVMRRAALYYQQVDSALAEHVKQKPELSGMGTTMTVGYSLGAELFLVHVGDSRAYLSRGAELRQLTHDHTHVQEMADAGFISREEVATHRLRHVLTNVLGGHGQVDVDVHRLQLVDGDRLLLCTDGLTDLVDDAKIAEVLARHPGPREATRELVDQALDRGGNDNVTVVLANYSVP
jgi:protein phosphatase